VLGDLLVHASSATGVTRQGLIVDGAQSAYVPSAHHFALLNHPRIADLLVEWLNARASDPRALTAGKAHIHA
jgi:hypothetical protein